VPAMRWDNFLDAYPKSHLVVAWLHELQRTGEVRRQRLDALERVARALKPREDWASEAYSSPTRSNSSGRLFFTLPTSPPTSHASIAPP
jgi:hypothetical protein